jgi:ABC-type transporter Mla MlaB component
MLRITVQDEPDQITLKLEGNLGGIWVTELEDSWRAVNSTLAGRSLRLDLTAVDRVDSAGNYLLALLRRSGAELIASGTAMSELVLSIARDWPLNKWETSEKRSGK